MQIIPRKTYILLRTEDADLSKLNINEFFLLDKDGKTMDINEHLLDGGIYNHWTYALVPNENPKLDTVQIEALSHNFVMDFFYPDIQSKGENEDTNNMKVFVRNWLKHHFNK